MLKSFLQIAIRNFTKRKGYSILNLLGLTIGITCFLLIFEYEISPKSKASAASIKCHSCCLTIRAMQPLLSIKAT